MPKGYFKARDLSPIAVEASELEIETPDRGLDERLLDSITQTFTKRLQDTRFKQRSVTPSPTEDIRATKALAATALQELTKFRPFGGNREWSPKKPVVEARGRPQPVRAKSKKRPPK